MTSYRGTDVQLQLLYRRHIDLRLRRLLAKVNVKVYGTIWVLDEMVRLEVLTKR